MRVVVDSGVWIDLFANRDTIETIGLRVLLENEHRLLVADLVLTEVLQGTRGERDFARKVALLDAFDIVSISDRQVAIQATRNYQALRARGITIRKTIDTLIATRCILDGLPLLYSDRDFDPFVQHLGLRSALDHPGVT